MNPTTNRYMVTLTSHEGGALPHPNDLAYVLRSVSATRATGLFRWSLRAVMAGVNKVRVTRIHPDKMRGYQPVCDLDAKNPPRGKGSLTISAAGAQKIADSKLSELLTAATLNRFGDITNNELAALLERLILTFTDTRYVMAHADELTAALRESWAIGAIQPDTLRDTKTADTELLDVIAAEKREDDDKLREGDE